MRDIKYLIVLQVCEMGSCRVFHVWYVLDANESNNTGQYPSP